MSDIIICFQTAKAGTSKTRVLSFILYENLTFCPVGEILICKNDFPLNFKKILVRIYVQNVLSTIMYTVQYNMMMTLNSWYSRYKIPKKNFSCDLVKLLSLAFQLNQNNIFVSFQYVHALGTRCFPILIWLVLTVSLNLRD